MSYQFFANPKKCMRNSTGKYLEGSHFSKEKEIELIITYCNNREIKLVAPIVKNKLGYINKIAEKYVTLARNHIVYKDLVGAGVLGLIRALNTYETCLNVEFQTHADFYVRSAIIKELHLFNSTRNPRNVWRMLSNITFLKTCPNCKRRCVY